MDTVTAVLNALAPNTYYRPGDVAQTLSIAPQIAGKALASLYRGCLVERHKDGKRVVYLTKQQRLGL